MSTLLKPLTKQTEEGYTLVSNNIIQFYNLFKDRISDIYTEWEEFFTIYDQQDVILYLQTIHIQEFSIRVWNDETIKTVIRICCG